VSGIVLHRPLLGRDAEGVRDALCGPLVVAGESDADVRVVEDAVAETSLTLENLTPLLLAPERRALPPMVPPHRRDR
jgi:hypothetical protein